MTLEYLIVGLVLAAIGILQIVVRRRGWEAEESPGWTVVLGPAALVLGAIAVAAGLLGW